MSDAPAAGRFDALGFVKMARRLGHGAPLGFRHVDHGDDWAELVLPYSPDLVGLPDTGVLATGPIISLMDMAMSLAIWIKSGAFRPQATLDLRVDYLRAARPGADLFGRGECHKITRSVAFVGGTAHDGDPDDPVARFAATFMFTADWTGG